MAELTKDNRTGKARNQGMFWKMKNGGGKVKERLMELMDHLFDVSKQIPEVEQDFFEDQKMKQEMVISPP